MTLPRGSQGTCWAGSWTPCSPKHGLLLCLDPKGPAKGSPGKGGSCQAYRPEDPSGKHQPLTLPELLPSFPLPSSPNTQRSTAEHLSAEMCWRSGRRSRRRKGFRLTWFPRRWRREKWMREWGVWPPFIVLLHCPRPRVTQYVGSNVPADSPQMQNSLAHGTGCVCCPFNAAFSFPPSWHAHSSTEAAFKCRHERPKGFWGRNLSVWAEVKAQVLEGSRAERPCQPRALWRGCL